MRRRISPRRSIEPEEVTFFEFIVRKTGYAISLVVSRPSTFFPFPSRWFFPPTIVFFSLSVLPLSASSSSLSFFLPLERDSTKGWGFVLTNPRSSASARRLSLSFSLFLSSRFFRFYLRAFLHGDPFHVCSCRVLRPSLSSAIELTCLRAERRAAGGYFNLLVVLSRSPPAWSDVNTSG